MDRIRGAFFGILIIAIGCGVCVLIWLFNRLTGGEKEDIYAKIGFKNGGGTVEQGDRENVDKRIRNGAERHIDTT